MSAKFFLISILVLFSLNAFSLEKLKIAIDATYPPMEFEADDGKIIGLDVDLARELGKLLNKEIEFVVMPWDGILAGLMSNRYDLIMSAMNITTERSQQVNFVPYMNMAQVFVIRNGEKPVVSEKDLTNKIVAVQADTTSSSAVEEFQKKGIKIKSIKTFKGAVDNFVALKSKQADVIVIDDVVAFYYVALDKKTFAVSGTALKPMPIGIAVKKTDKILYNLISEKIKILKANGTYKKLYQKWLHTDPKENAI